MYIPNEQNIKQIIINKEYPYFMSILDTPDEVCIYNCLIFMWVSLIYFLYKYFDTYNHHVYVIKYKYQ